MISSETETPEETSSASSFASSVVWVAIIASGLGSAILTSFFFLLFSNAAGPPDKTTRVAHRNTFQFNIDDLDMETLKMWFDDPYVCPLLAKDQLRY